MTMCRKDGRLPHQESRFFLPSKRVGFSLDIRLSRKALKALLQSIYLILDLLHYKHNPHTTTVVDGSIF